MVNKRPLVAAPLALLISPAALAQPTDKNLQTGLKAISPAEAYDIVKILASPEYAGRLTGHPGYTAAAEWAARKLGAWGLKPVSGKDRFSDSGDRTAEAVFAGWGISAPDFGYDDYAGLDVQGKFVVCFRGTPSDDRRFQVHDERRTRMRTARDKGALGLINPDIMADAARLAFLAAYAWADR